MIRPVDIHRQFREYLLRRLSVAACPADQSGTDAVGIGDKRQKQVLRKNHFIPAFRRQTAGIFKYPPQFYRGFISIITFTKFHCFEIITATDKQKIVPELLI